MAKKFFYVCGGLLMLALAYHLGATSATAQAPSNSVVGTFGELSPQAVVTANGDVYVSSGNPQPLSGWSWRANIFGGGDPVPTTDATWGQVKARYR